MAFLSRTKAASSFLPRFARSERCASSGSSYAPVQRRAVPRQLEGIVSDAPSLERSVPSVAELHVGHCQSLAMQPKSSEANWNWASLRACKLANTMKPTDIQRHQKWQFHILWSLASDVWL